MPCISCPDVTSLDTAFPSIPKKLGICSLRELGNSRQIIESFLRDFRRKKREAFKILPGDRNVRLVVHEPHRFECPPSRTNPERYTHISIDAFAGRSLEAKRRLYRTIVDNLQARGIPKDHVKILIREIPKANWGIRGGQAGCDVELGFKIDV